MKNVVTISREFGSGGRTIAKAVAEELGYKFYDRELIEKIAEESGLSKEFIENNGEHAPGKSIFSYSFLGRNEKGESMQDVLFNIQREIILKIAEEGKCVIVGRCADYILKDRDDVLNVFIYADTATKAKRIVEVYGETGIKPEKRLADKDKKRKANYNYYTDREWGKTQNYDICLDSSKLGFDKCEEIIVGIAK